MSLRYRLDCLVDFLRMILLCLLPLPNRFFRVCLPTYFAAVLKDFLPLITSLISGAANSNMSALRRIADGTIYLRKKGISVLPKTFAGAPNSLPVCCSSPKNLCKCTESPSTLSSNHSIVWDFYLF